jgi:hypothetical protein
VTYADERIPDLDVGLRIRHFPYCLPVGTGSSVSGWKYASTFLPLSSIP